MYISCLIHQEVLCVKITKFKRVIVTVVKAANVILSRRLSHLQFRQLLLETKNEHGYLLYFYDIHCLLVDEVCLQEVVRLEMR